MASPSSCSHMVGNDFFCQETPDGKVNMLEVASVGLQMGSLRGIFIPGRKVQCQILSLSLCVCVYTFKAYSGLG